MSSLRLLPLLTSVFAVASVRGVGLPPASPEAMAAEVRALVSSGAGALMPDLDRAYIADGGLVPLGEGDFPAWTAPTSPTAASSRSARATSPRCSSTGSWRSGGTVAGLSPHERPLRGDCFRDRHRCTVGTIAGTDPERSSLSEMIMLTSESTRLMLHPRLRMGSNFSTFSIKRLRTIPNETQRSTKHGKDC